MNTTKKVTKLLLQYKRYLVLLLLGIPFISQLDVWSQTILGTIVDNIANSDEWLLITGVYVTIIIAHFIIKHWL